MTNPSDRLTRIRAGGPIGPADAEWLLGEVERLQMRLKRHEPVSLYNGHDIDWWKAEAERLRGNLSLAEEGLANYALEVERKNSLVDLQDEAQTSLHAENVRLREENEQLQSRLEGSQAAAAVGEREIERLQTLLIRVLEDGEPSQDLLQEIDEAVTEPAHEPSELRPPVKLEDYGPVIDEVAPVTKEAWDAMKSQGASRDASPADLVGALQDVVHTDPGPVRAAAAVKSIECPQCFGDKQIAMSDWTSRTCEYCGGTGRATLRTGE